MSKSCGSKISIFQEAIDHCRWKTVLRNNVLTQNELQEHNLHQFAGKRFDEIILRVYNMCDKIKGIGMLSIYDITSAICRYNKIIIDKIYIIGKGPKRAISLLNIKAKTQKRRLSPNTIQEREKIENEKLLAKIIKKYKQINKYKVYN